MALTNTSNWRQVATLWITRKVFCKMIPNRLKPFFGQKPGRLFNWGFGQLWGLGMRWLFWSHSISFGVEPGFVDGQFGFAKTQTKITKRAWGIGVALLLLSALCRNQADARGNNMTWPRSCYRCYLKCFAGGNGFLRIDPIYHPISGQDILLLSLVVRRNSNSTCLPGAASNLLRPSLSMRLVQSSIQ